ncbi:MAG: hypothetical protein K2Q22_05060, partial [Cytophagales bacterium]|nr:hypothetical protein [Cytophagales bacterium]
MKPFDFKKLVPHIFVVLFFYVAVAIYFSPMTFGNKTLGQMDIVQWSGAAKSITDFRAKYGEEPLWTNSLFGGMPAYLVSTEYPGNLFHTLHYKYLVNLPLLRYPSSLVFISLVCFYILMLTFDLSIYIAVLGAVSFTFASFTFISIEAGHNSKVAAIAYMPLVLAGVIMGFRKNILLGCSVFGLSVALQMVSNHFQITYYTILILGLFFVFKFIQDLKDKQLLRFFKICAFLALSGILGAATNAGSLLCTNEYGKYSIRGKSELKPKDNPEVRGDGLDRDYAFRWSSGITETFTLLIPDFYGGASNGALSESSETFKELKSNNVPISSARDFISRLPLYWGDMPFTSGPIYLGAIVIFLFVLGILVVEAEMRNWLIAITVLSLILSWGKNFAVLNYLLFDYLPLYNKFRAPSMSLVIAQFSVPLLAALALDRFLKMKDLTQMRKKLFLSAGITGGFCLFIALMAFSARYAAEADENLRQMAGDWLVNAIRSDRQSLRRNDAFRSMFLIALAAGLCYLYLTKKLSQKIILPALTALVFIELWAVD